MSSPRLLSCSPIATTKARLGSMSSCSYSDRCAWNHSRLLSSRNPLRNVSSSGRNPLNVVDPTVAIINNPSCRTDVLDYRMDEQGSQKRCCRCGEFKDACEFNFKDRAVDRRHTFCRECQHAWNRAHYE